MIRGAIIAAILLSVLDLSLNHGQIVQHVATRVMAFGSASSHAIKTSIFNQ